MKRSLLFLLVPALLLGSCVLIPSKSSSSPTTSTQPTSSSTPTTTIPDPTSNTSDTSDSSTDTSTSEDEPPVVTKQTISQIKTDAKVGEWVKFDATYLRALTWTNEDLMYFADANDYIWFRVPYANYSGYLANRYRMKEYTVLGKLAEVNGVLEVQYSSQITPQESVISLGDTYPLSYNENNVATTVTGIAQIKAKSGQITLNNKGHGVGEVVKFTSQVVQTEYTDANIKAMVLDSDGNSVTVIGDGKKMVGQDDIGKIYTWVGIISIQTSIPAILGISCTYVSQSNTVDVSNATEVSPSAFKNYGLTSSKYTPLSNNDYFKLYKASGYLKNNSDITTSYNLGVVDTNTGSLSDNNISTKSVAGFYLVNYTGLDSLAYCPDIIVNNLGQNVKLTFYFSIRAYDTQNHIWEMFIIEDLIELAE